MSSRVASLNNLENSLNWFSEKILHLNVLNNVSAYDVRDVMRHEDKYSLEQNQRFC